MALTAEQRWSAAKIDTRMQKLIRAGKDDMTIVAAMADHMLKAKHLLETIQLADLATCHNSVRRSGRTDATRPRWRRLRWQPGVIKPS